MIRLWVSIVFFAGISSLGMRIAKAFGANTGEILADFMLQLVNALFTGQGIPSDYFADAISSNLIGIGTGVGIILLAFAGGVFVFKALK